ncbi:MAG: hypothetical protein A2309_05545 [Bacteroidetes bacterium RIFOXYB2_FULL_35_7]|nr:MAG: hypothetical protein A2X01_00020 [Bacteroidetes bacterium GWF2_35_48]OFY94961.1 MAG: hypothetical protein A2309_05545 [Bacteroidetes bacterium RIFOXYB2_FULL_35_7]OFZ04212.1 MAG: hypothetical protein A2491_18120 [Bacteroidetes bacterium RIFOXYC12_FULL_35_7]HBX53050.1 hypothetical protein [Bacteroidales bacterium]
MCVVNNTNKEVFVVANFDTISVGVISWVKKDILRRNVKRNGYKPAEIIAIQNSEFFIANKDWELDVKRNKGSLLYLFVFDYEKIKNVAIDSIEYPRDSLFKRFDLSLDSLEKMNWTVILH